MSSATRRMFGIVDGRTIRLESEPGGLDGRAVVVTLEPVAPADLPTDEDARETLRRAAGSWAEEGEELDHFLE